MMTVMDVISKTVDDANIYKLYEDFSNELITAVSRNYISNLAGYSKNRVASYSVLVCCNIATDDENTNDNLNIVEIRII